MNDKDHRLDFIILGLIVLFFFVLIAIGLIW